jgi:hypothetical protein
VKRLGSHAISPDGICRPIHRPVQDAFQRKAARMASLLLQPAIRSRGRPAVAATAEAMAALPSDGLLTTRQAAAWLGLSPSTLQDWRVYGGGPEFLKIGKRRVAYELAELQRFAAQNRYGSTSEYGRKIRG